MGIQDEYDVLGLCLFDPDEIPRCLAAGLTGAHFSVPDYGRLWEHMVASRSQGNPLRRGSFQESVGRNPLFDRIDESGSYAPNSAHYAKRVISAQKIDSLAVAFGDYAARLRHEDCDDGQLASICAEAFALLEAKTAPPKEAHAKSRLSEVYATTLELIGAAIDRRASGELPGIPTGLTTLDSAMAGGWQKASSTVLGALSGKGKTHCGVYFMLCAAQAGFRVAYLTVEMPKVQIMRRLMANVSGINSKKLASGDLSTPELDRLFDIERELKRYRIDIIDDFGDSHEELLSRLRLLTKDKERGPVDLFVVDYIQQLRSSRRYGTRTDELYAISFELKQFALRHQISGLQLAQLNGRTYELASVGQPPDSKCIEHCHGIYQNGDTVLFYYEPKGGNKEAFHVPKNRHGEDGFDIDIVIDKSVSQVREA